MRIFYVGLLSLALLFLPAQKNAFAMFGSLAALIPPTVATDINTAVQDIELTTQTISTVESVYYQTESLINMMKNIHNFTSFLMAAQQAQSMYMSLDAMGYQLVDQLDQQQGITPDYQQQAQNLQSLSEDMMLTSALESSGADIATISSQAANAQGFALLNGASMGAQAALTTTQAVDNLLQYQTQKDQNKKQLQQIRQTTQEQQLAAASVNLVKVPCVNRAAYVNIYEYGNTNTAVPCTQTGLPRPVVVTGRPVGLGIDSEIATAKEQQCAQAAARQAMANAKAAGAGIGLGVSTMPSCGNITPPVFENTQQTPPTPPPAIVNPPGLNPSAPPMGSPLSAPLGSGG